MKQTFTHLRDKTSQCLLRVLSCLFETGMTNKDSVDQSTEVMCCSENERIKGNVLQRKMTGWVIQRAPKTTLMISDGALWWWQQ